MQFPDGNGFAREFYTLIIEDAAKAGYEPEWLLGVLASESSLMPWAYNKNGGAQGISQMMPQTLRNMHLAVDGYKDLPAHKQIVDTFAYLREWQKRFKMPKWQNRAQLYLCNFLPALLPIATLPDSILVARSRSKVIYDANAGLDANKDSFITLAEMEIAIDHAIKGYAGPRYRTALASLEFVRSGKLPTTLKDIQTAVKAAGFDPGPLDGIPGPKTTKGVKAFQKAKGLVVDGIVGPKTLAALGL
jgi:hypothetical protein